MEIAGIDLKLIAAPVIVVVVLTAAALLLFGAIGPSPTPTPLPSAAPQPVCGNGVLEPGEGFATCCADAGCPAGFSCANGVCSQQAVVQRAAFAEQFWMGVGDTTEVAGLVTITANSESSFTITWPGGATTTEQLAAGQSATHSYVTVQALRVLDGKASLVATAAFSEASPGQFINLMPGQAVKVGGMIIGLKSSGTEAVLEVITTGTEELGLAAGESAVKGGYTIQALAVRQNGSVMLVVTTA